MCVYVAMCTAIVCAKQAGTHVMMPTFCVVYHIIMIIYTLYYHKLQANHIILSSKQFIFRIMSAECMAAMVRISCSSYVSSYVLL